MSNDVRIAGDDEATIPGRPRSLERCESEESAISLRGGKYLSDSEVLEKSISVITMYAEEPEEEKTSGD